MRLQSGHAAAGASPTKSATCQPERRKEEQASGRRLVLLHHWYPPPQPVPAVPSSLPVPGPAAPTPSASPATGWWSVSGGSDANHYSPQANQSTNPCCKVSVHVRSFVAAPGENFHFVHHRHHWHMDNPNLKAPLTLMAMIVSRQVGQQREGIGHMKRKFDWRALG